MCYHVSNTKSALEIENRFNARFEDIDVYEPFYHLSGFEHGYLYGILQEEPSIIEPIRWGLIEVQGENYDLRLRDVEDVTAYWKEKGGYCLNITAEKVFNYYVTSEAILSRRCIIPITGFYEPHRFSGKSFPYYIHPKDGDFLALAGIYNEYDTGFFTCDIITVPANPMLAEIHNHKKRQPAILHPDHWEHYLDSSITADEIKEILFTDTNQELDAYPVTKDVLNSHVKSNFPAAIKRHDYPDLNTLF